MKLPERIQVSSENNERNETAPIKPGLFLQIFYFLWSSPLAISLTVVVKKIPFSTELDTWDITEETGAVYWLEGSSHPEYGGNTVIAAHYMEYGEPGPLFRVRDLTEGDEIYLYSGFFKYTYKVVRYQYIPDNYMEYLKNRPYALTLFTCSGFNWDTGVWDQRAVVLAELSQIDFVESPKNY